MAKPQLKQGVRSADRLRSRMKMPPLVQPSRIKAVATTKTSKAVFLTERENGVVSPAEEDSPGEQNVVMIDVQTGAEGDSRQDKISPADILQKSGEKDYGKVYEVDLHAEDITRIHNLEKFTKLRILDLSCNQLTTIEKLDQNKDLRELKLYGNKITDVQNLDRLQELACLQLQHNRIRRLGKGLSCLRKLKILRIDSNDISQLEGKELTANSQLTHLDVSCNKLQELAAVNCLPHLEELNASNNRLAAIRTMRCKKLQDLDLSTNFLTDLSGLKDLHSLTTLNLATNRLSSLTAIGKLRHLQDLNVSNNLLKELGNISEQFPALEVFNVSENAIVSWEQVCLLSKCLQLAELHISGNPFCKERFSYHQELQSQIPSLELLDGLTTKRQCGRVGSAPVMRPMSASTIVSARQVESQLRNVEQQLSTFQTDLGQRFSSLRATMDSLPVEPPLSARSVGDRSDSRPSSGASSRPVSRCSSRARLKEAKDFAAKNFQS
ncbi:PREDICTED: protein phosphatase 1 regulatory subunit 7-like [Branchiostoma belcheri]|uniref:Protein phosphatase 1 regulatory subunit 7-like n=1 Tax=Branchiostoma belcheri TaxID=7741 RepID=A0A6P4ZN11_BRABE|nr:PREDICTED: protein phosphatase 1 regulatory subunit 7-like [Branchiostoma belcheri]